MKHRTIFFSHILIALFLIKFNLGNAQSFVHFPMDSTTWKVLLRYYSPITCEESYVFEYAYKGDTLINNVEYKIIKSTNLSLYDHVGGSYNCSGYQNFYDELYLRQDTILKKVFEIPVFQNTEILLYDFNLSVGDTLFGTNMINPNCNAFDVVKSIDTINVNNHSLRRWLFDCLEPVVEGIGSLESPFVTISYWFQIVCVTKQSERYQVWDMTPDNNPDSVFLEAVCSFVNPVLEPQAIISEFKFYYSMEKRELSIKSENKIFSTSANWICYDLLGREVSNGSLNSFENNNTTIDCNRIQRGIYIFKIFSSTKKINYSKLILIY